MNVFRPLHLRSHYRNTCNALAPKRKNAEDISLTAKQLSPFEKERQRSRGYLGSSSVFKVFTLLVHLDLMVLAQSLDNFIVRKSAQLLMYYYQPLVCRTAQAFLLMSLYCSTLPTEYLIALKLSATFIAELTSYFVL